jgi:hypothetical protein
LPRALAADEHPAVHAVHAVHAVPAAIPGGAAKATSWLEGSFYKFSFSF